MNYSNLLVEIIEIPRQVVVHEQGKHWRFMLKTTKPPRSQKGMRRLLKWYEKKGRPITRTVILYRSEPLARNFIRTQHQALTLGTKRASALGAATLERETRNAKKEQQTRGRLRDGTKVGCNP